MTLIIFLFVLSFLILIHEFGHYFIARILGVRVEGMWMPRVTAITSLISRPFFAGSYRSADWGNAVHSAVEKILKEESYDKRGELKKKKEFQYRKLKEYHVMERIYVDDVQKNHTTEITFTDIQVDTGIDKNLFQEKNLKRLPRN